ncbi:MAG: TIGR01777 family oxidoreductase [Actinomycetes bacterium]
MKVVFTGASGLLGQSLVASLRQDGHEVVRLVRRDPSAPDESRWDPSTGYVDPTALAGADAVVNMAGPGLGDRPWTPAYRRTVLTARVEATRTIATAMAAAEPRPRVLLSSSAIGYYGTPGEQVVDEDAPVGDTYLARIAAAWEDATEPARLAGIRVVTTRTAVVLSAEGGAFGRRLLPLFKLGLGGRLGSGRQWWSWVSIDDYVRAMRFLLEHEEIEGPVNISAPEPIRNADLTKAMGRVLHRPAIFWAPGFALKIPLRDFAEDLLGGQRVAPRRLLDAGFTFAHPSFEPALRAALHRPYDAATS